MNRTNNALARGGRWPKSTNWKSAIEGLPIWKKIDLDDRKAKGEDKENIDPCDEGVDQMNMDESENDQKDTAGFTWVARYSLDVMFHMSGYFSRASTCPTLRA